MSNSRESIKVICRIRPENQREIESGCKGCILSTDQSVKIQIDSEKNEGGHEFTFDKVFGSNSKQEDVFEFCAKPIIKSALEGYNGTIFCYGQTSSGKTFTMEGVHTIEHLRGLIPRSMEYIFELIKNASSDIEFSVKCSYLEIYNEKIQDLLDPRKTNLMVKEEKEKGLWVQDATEVYVACEEEMYEVFQVGTENRTVGNTKMNAKSSRSHSLFIITIFQRDSKTDSTKAGKLYFVDLAGSEKISKTGVEGQLLEDAKNINKSLLMLGMVINALTENKPYVPYRDSKLTRVLQESLGGNSLTTLIVTCSPNAFNDKESLSTLRFGQRAKSIKNKVTLNAEKSAKELLLKLNEAEEKIKYYQNILTRLEMAEGLNFSLKDFLTENKISIVDKNNDCKSMDPTKRNSIAFKPKLSPFTEENTNNSVTDAHNVNSKFTYKKCEDCSEAMRKVLNQHIELVTLQDEVEKIKELKAELEIEIETRNHEIFEKNEKILLIEMQTKTFIKSQHNSITDLILKLDQIFLINQKKFSLSSNIKNIYDNMIFELKDMKSNNINNNLTSIEKLNKAIEESYISIQKVERLILNDNKIFNRIIEILNEISANLENHIAINFVNDKQGLEDINNHTKNNNSSNNNFNNINLNFNKNININIINPKERTNNFDFGGEANINNNPMNAKRKHVSVSNSLNIENDPKKSHKRTNSFSYFDKENVPSTTCKYTTEIEKTENKNINAINIFNNIKNELNFTNALYNNRKKLSLIIDANKVSKINKLNYYSPIYKGDILSRREKNKSNISYNKLNYSDHTGTGNDNSHSSYNHPLLDIDIQENDPFVEQQLKAFENYDCQSISTEIDFNKNIRSHNNNLQTPDQVEFDSTANVYKLDFMENKNINATSINSINNLKDIINNQRITILNLAHKYKKIEHVLFNIKRENSEKENSINKAKDLKIKEHESNINKYEIKLSNLSQEYEDYKIKAFEDFAYKEKKLMELINKISDLEDENYRIIHSSKDVDKKKYLLMEKKTKDLTLELQRLIAENSEQKNVIDKKNEEITMLYLRLNDLEKKIISLQEVTNELTKLNNELKNENQNKPGRLHNKKVVADFINNISIKNVAFGKTYNEEVSFSNMNPSSVQSGICTPITNYLNKKNFDQNQLNALLVPKLNNLKKEKDTSNENNIHKDHNRNGSDNNFNISEISNFSLKNNTSIFQNKAESNNEKANKAMYSGNNYDYSNVSFNKEDGNLQSLIEKEQQPVHKLKDTNINNPFSKNFKQSNNLMYNYTSSQFLSNSSNKIVNNSNKIMRVIKGGNGKNEPNQNHFFSKMLNTNVINENNLIYNYDNSMKTSLIKQSNTIKQKINIDKLQREKFEQELRMLDCDDLNNSGDSELKINSNRDNNKKPIINQYSLRFNDRFDDPLSSRVKTPEKNTKSSIWNIFS